jgi:hypothetical protein
VFDVFFLFKGHDEAMGLSTGHWDSREVPSVNIACTFESSEIGVLRRDHCSVRALGSAKAELDAF